MAAINSPLGCFQTATTILTSHSEDKPVVSSLDLKVVFPVKREPIVRRSQPSEIDMAYSPGGSTGPCIPPKVLEYIDNTLYNECEDIKQALISFNFVIKEMKAASDPTIADLEELEGKVEALENAMNIKDTDMNEIKTAYEVQIENLEDRLLQSVPILHVPMPAGTPPPVKSCVCSKEADEYRVALEYELEATDRRFHAMYGHARELASEVSRLELLVQRKDDMAAL